MIPRNEHPKPLFERSNWLCLNGIWDFEFDFAASGNERGLFEETAEFSKKITVPFCVESKLSGIEYKDFINAVWYKREIELGEEQLRDIIRLHFGAVDYETSVYINGKLCGSHKGGYSSFYFDINHLCREGKNVITVFVRDDTRSPMIPSGKQSFKHNSFGCYYTRTTGIWQSVWLEFIPETHIEKLKYSTDIATATLVIKAELKGNATFKAKAFFGGKPVGEAEAESRGENIMLTLPLSELHLWEIGKGNLYDLELSYGDDKVKSYFGMRSVGYDGFKFLINGKSVFQRLVLDQGFYPDGIYTAPSDSELSGDIDRALAMGFNGARLHEKVFEERFLYHCDKKGYIVWGEFPNWGLDISYPEALFVILPEWLEILDRDMNHPAIIGWCPFNETWDEKGRKQCDEILSTIYSVTKAVDPSRPCIDTSGNYHIITDVYDVHDYDQNPEILREHFAKLPTENSFFDNHGYRQQYKPGLPVFVSEFGGTGWISEQNGWGYGNIPQTPKEYLERVKGLAAALLDNECISGFCYTQLTDVEQECNGLYTYDRKPKFAPEIINPFFSRRAAIEEQE